MRRILATSNEHVLAHFARSNTLVAFDFDGTLAPIVDDRSCAAMRPTTHHLLATVSERYPCAVISGRSLADITERLAGIPLRCVIGNHGMEPSKRMDRYEASVAVFARQFAHFLADEHGIEVENKRYSLSLHYRAASDKRAARAAIARAATAIAGPFRLASGKLVVNVVPNGAPNKGTALEGLLAQYGVTTAIFVGDDTTDEDVFELGHPSRILTIRVGEKRDSAAQYSLRDQSQIDVLLRRLAALREPSAPRTEI